MSGKSRIIRSVKSRRTTCGTENCFRINGNTEQQDLFTECKDSFGVRRENRAAQTAIKQAADMIKA